jgi:NADH-quinone oxidoreductase subunit L
MNVIQFLSIHAVLCLFLWVGQHFLSSKQLSSLQILGYLGSLFVLIFFKDTSPIAWEWMHSGDMRLNLLFKFVEPGQSLLLALHIIAIASIYFAQHYFEPENKSFWTKLSFFVLGMIGLLTVQNVLGMFIFWEWIGIASFVLIGYDKSPQSSSSSLYALLTNRIGDVLLLLGIICFLSLEPLENASKLGFLTSLLIALGTLCKSAQLPFSLWLSKAMDGPTPVSALLHSATLVAAGAFVLIKVSLLLHPDVLQLVQCIGVLTAAFGAFSAIFQDDIKQILGFSTLSQLGLVFAAIGVGNIEAAYMHLFVHAFFKSTLFIGLGILMLQLKKKINSESISVSNQSLKALTHIKHISIGVFLPILFSGLALMGFPLSSGFITKESIIEGFFHQTHVLSLACGAILLLSSLGTAIYVSRILLKLSLGLSKSFQLEHLYIWLGVPGAFFFFVSGSAFPSSNLIFSFISVLMIGLGVWIALKIHKEQWKFQSNLPEKVEFGIRWVIQQFERILLILNAWIERIIKLTERFLNLILSILRNLSQFIEEKIFEGTINLSGFVLVEIGGIFRFLQNGYLMSYILAALVLFLSIVYLISIC